jgi:hypothetical protein
MSPFIIHLRLIAKPVKIPIAQPTAKVTVLWLADFAEFAALNRSRNLRQRRHFVCYALSYSRAILERVCYRGCYTGSFANRISDVFTSFF